MVSRFYEGQGAGAATTSAAPKCEIDSDRHHGSEGGQKEWITPSEVVTGEGSYLGYCGGPRGAHLRQRDWQAASRAAITSCQNSDGPLADGKSANSGLVV